MGCCFSTPNSKQHQNGLKNHQAKLRSHGHKSNATHEVHRGAPPSPPPQSVEEETVKEVLSETPISKPHQVPILMSETNTQMPNIQHRKGPIINKACNMSESFSEEVSQISETCSMNESFSTTTTATTATVTEKREDEATSKRTTGKGTQNRNRSQSKRSYYTVDGNRVGGREQQRPKSPARMPEPPPKKRIPVSSRSGRRRESGQVLRDSGEASGRRSRSPSSARTVIAAGNGRSQMKPPPGVAGRRLPQAKRVEKEKVGEEKDDVPQVEESLENPHVSLECFIFL